MVDGKGGVRILLNFDEESSLSALDLSAFIFDINRMYVVAWHFSEDGDGSAREFRGFGRNSYRLPRESRLNVSRIRFESPGLIELVTAFSLLSASIWALVQAFDKIKSWPLAQQKLRLEVEKLRRDLGMPAQLPQPVRLEPYLTLPEVQGAIKQLDNNPLKPAEIKLLPGATTPRDRR